MIAALTILPLGSSLQFNPLMAEIFDDTRAQHVLREMTASGACLEGSWEEIMMVAKRAHLIARQKAPHVVTLLRIEDEQDPVEPLAALASAVEGRPESVRRAPQSAEEEAPDVGPGAVEPQFA